MRCYQKENYMFRVIFVITFMFTFVPLIHCDDQKGKGGKETKATKKIGFSKPTMYKNLLETKKRIEKKEPQLLQAYQQLLKQAQKALKEGPYSVMTKKLMPKSGDKHDYFSMGIYWWPNPKTKSGLPYIRKDGQVNPDAIKNTDKFAYQKMLKGVNQLCLIYFFREEEVYAAHATKLLDTWFLNAKTKMNPNLIHAQAIPGICDGRDIGLIDTHGFPRMLAMTLLLSSSKSWTKKKQKGLRKWVRKYLTWFLTSKNGKSESLKKNNHGTYYDSQVLGYAYYLGDRKLMRKIALKSKGRFVSQIRKDGQQPHEIKRAISFSYSCFNIKAFIRICQYAELVGVNYWDLKGKGSLRKAVGYLLKNAPPANMKKWPHKQIKPIERAKPFYRVMLQVMGTKLKEPSFLEAAKSMNGVEIQSSFSFLLYPPKVK